MKSDLFYRISMGIIVIAILWIGWGGLYQESVIKGLDEAVVEEYNYEKSELNTAKVISAEMMKIPQKSKLKVEVTIYDNDKVHKFYVLMKNKKVIETVKVK